MTNSGMKRMSKYMLVFAERVLLLFVGFLIVWCIYMAIVTGNFSVWGPGSIVANLPSYFLMLGALIMMIVSMGYVPLLSTGHLSMGATRREVSFGISLAFLLLSIQISVVGVIIYFIIDSSEAMHLTNLSTFGDAWSYFATTFGVLLFVSGIGILLALLIQRFGRVAYYIFVGVIAILAGIAGGVSAYMMGSGDFSFVMNHIGIIALIIGAVIYAAGCFFYRVATRKLAVTV